jgi:hypothetical protein
MIVPIGVQGPSAAGVTGEVDAVAELIQQHALERAKRRLLCVGGEACERRAIGVEKRLVASSRQAAAGEVVEVIGDSSRPARARAAPAAFAPRERASIARPDQEDDERLEGRSTARSGTSAPRAVRRTAYAAVAASRVEDRLLSLHGR